MLPQRQGSIHLGRFAGVHLYLHWSWVIAVLIELSSRRGYYQSRLWNVIEYLALFAIVLLHEFGHAAACRSVGGKADEIVLWPLGGVAYVAPPPRPGATLWSIAAGPLVNVGLFPVFWFLDFAAGRSGWILTMPDFVIFLRAVYFINLGLLVFNLLPIYPLDGGQIVRSLLWFVVGRARSLAAASVIGFVGVAGIGLVAWRLQSIWIGIVALFIVANCWRGLQHARSLARLAALPRREDFACPHCGNAPPAGVVFGCTRCRKTYDPLETAGLCPHCGTATATVPCLECGNRSPVSAWRLPPVG